MIVSNSVYLNLLNYKNGVPNANTSPQGRGYFNMFKMSSLINRFDDINTKYPDVIILIKDDDYYSFRDNALRVSKIVGTSLKQTNYNEIKIQYTSFDFHSLDAFLPKLVKAGFRVGICEINEFKPASQEPKKVPKAGALSNER